MNKLLFENLFTQQEDPWFINSRVSQHKRHKHGIDLLQKYAQHLESILDVGCALGTTTHTLSQYFPQARIIGTDISENAIEKARNIYPTLHFEVQSLPHLSYDKNSFDAIYALEVIYCLPEELQKKALENCHALLKKDGIIILSASCDPTAVPDLNKLLTVVDTTLFKLEYRGFTYGYFFFRFEGFLINIYNVSLYLTTKGRFVLPGKLARFFIKQALNSHILLYVFTLPSRILKRKPLHQFLVLRKK